MSIEKTLEQLLEEDSIGKIVEYSQKAANKGFTLSKETHAELEEFHENWDKTLEESAYMNKLQQFPPPEADMPCLVFVSASWCPPCKVIKPTFYELARNFSKARVFYADADELDAWKQGVEFVPQLVAFFPGGKKVTASCGSSTTELWKNMNLLFTVGASYKGEHGELVCTDTECSIKDWESRK